MPNPTYFLSRCLPVALVMWMTSCITSRSGELAIVENWPPEHSSAESKPSIQLRFRVRSVINGHRTSVSQHYLELLVRPIERAFVDSNFFSSVSRDQTDADVVADIDIETGGSYNTALTFLCGATLTVIPATADERTAVTANFQRDGESIGSTRFTERRTLWVQLLLIFAMPFRSADLSAEELQYDFGCATVLAGHERGWF